MPEKQHEWISCTQSMPAFNKRVAIEAIDRVHQNCHLEYYDDDGISIGFLDEYLQEFIPFRNVLRWRDK